MDSFDTSLASFMTKADHGDQTAAKIYGEKGFKIFRTISIVLFVVAFILSIISIVDSAYLFWAADQETLSDSWKKSARSLGAVNIVFGVLLIAAGITGAIAMVRFEKTMKVALHDNMTASSAPYVQQTSNAAPAVPVDANNPVPGDVNNLFD